MPEPRATPSAGDATLSSAAARTAPSSGAGTGRADLPLRGIAWMVLGVLMLSLMDAVSKYAVSQMATLPLIAIRSLMVLALLSPLVLRGGGLAALRTRRPGGHLVRGACAIVSMLCFFEALRLLPLATAIAIGFAAPMFMTALSVPILKERVDAHRWAAVVVGFLGVCVVAGPALGDADMGLGALLMLGAAVFYAASMTCVRWLASTETDLSMMVSQNLLVLLVGTVGTLLNPSPVPLSMTGVILAMALLLVLGQQATFRALRLAPVGAVAPFHYTELVWAAVLGWVFWNEWPQAHVGWGALVIVAAGLYSVWREQRRSQGSASAP
jgi:drug/metabolite transporter (DMT)-like permease